MLRVIQFGGRLDCAKLCSFGSAPLTRLISSSQRPLAAQHTTYIRDEHPCPQRDSNPPSQHQTAQPLESASLPFTKPLTQTRTYDSVGGIVIGLPSRPVVFNLFCSRTSTYNFSSTLSPQSCWCIIQVVHSL